jgi:hypothetical protein
MDGGMDDGDADRSGQADRFGQPRLGRTMPARVADGDAVGALERQDDRGAGRLCAAGFSRRRQGPPRG